MPRVSVSNGIRPEFRALNVIKLNVPVTPSEINKEVGTGNYAAKYISLLRKVGFEFTTQKEGKTVVSYTLTKEPEKVDNFRKVGPAVAKAVNKVAPPKKVETKNASPVRIKPRVAPKVKPAKKDAFGNDALTGEVAAYATDFDYDSRPNLRDLGLDGFTP